MNFSGGIASHLQAIVVGRGSPEPREREMIMIQTNRKLILATMFIFATLFARESAAQISLGTAFSYQGSIRDGGGAADGDYDFHFSLWDAAAAGNQIGATIEHDVSGEGTVAVAEGLFSVALDFGAGACTGDARWLQISVRNEDPADLAPYTTLNPRVELHATPYALHAVNAGTLDGLDSLDFLEKDGRAFVIARTTDDPVLNGANLLTAYAQASVLTPHGQPLSADNRAAVLVPPGQYNMGTGQIILDTEFVDLIGLSTNRTDQYIFGESNGPGTGVIHQTASDVVIENLRVHCTRSSGAVSVDDTDPAAYFPDSALTAATVRNCSFEANEIHAFSTRLAVEYQGRYEDCSGSIAAFGGFGTASGTFLRCTGGESAFGGNTGTASGTFEDCVGGDSAFGGLGGTASGTFKDCVGGISSFGGSAGAASGTFDRCVGGDTAFGGFGTADGDFTSCIGGDRAFGGNGDATGYFDYCVAGNDSFGAFGTASGTFRFCTGGTQSFGTGGFSTGGFFLHCNAEFPSYSGPATATHLFCTQGNVQYAGND